MHGFTPEDVRKDEEGLQTMRTLAENMAWLLKGIETGQKEGLSYPRHEDVVRTHFIQRNNDISLRNAYGGNYEGHFKTRIRRRSNFT